MVGEGRRDPRLPASFPARSSRVGENDAGFILHHIGGLAEQQRRAKPRSRRGRLDAEPTLPRTPDRPGAQIETEIPHRRSGAKLRSPAQLRSTASTGQWTSDWKRSIAVATSSSSAAASQGSVVGFVVRADPHAIVGFALEVESLERVVDQRKVAQARTGRSAAARSSGEAAGSRAAQRRSGLRRHRPRPRRH